MAETSPIPDPSLEDVFIERYEAMAPALYAWARCRIPPALRKAVEAEDVLQETWCRVIAHGQDFDPQRGNFRQWVFGFARHVLSEMSQTVHSMPSRSANGSRVSRIAARITTVSRKAARNEGVARFLSHIHVFDATDRKLLLLRGLEGLSHEEVAEQFGTSAAAIRKRWQRLRERLEEAGVAALLLEVG